MTSQTIIPEARAYAQWQTIAYDNPVRVGQLLKGPRGYWTVNAIADGYVDLERHGLYVFPKLDTLTSPTWTIAKPAPDTLLQNWKWIGLAMVVAVVVVGGWLAWGL